MEWLRLIKDHIAANAEVTTDDLKEIPGFTYAAGSSG